jgi:hypothetical protein
MSADVNGWDSTCLPYCPSQHLARKRIEHSGFDYSSNRTGAFGVRMSYMYVVDMSDSLWGTYRIPRNTHGERAIREPRRLRPVLSFVP